MTTGLIDGIPGADYHKDRPMDNLSPNLLGKLARLALAIERDTDRLGACNWIKIRALVYDEEIQQWLADLERLAYVPFRKDVA